MKSTTKGRQKVIKSHAEVMRDVETEENGPVSKLIERTEEKNLLYMSKIVYTKEKVIHNDQPMIQTTKTITFMGLPIGSYTTLEQYKKKSIFNI